MSVLERETAAEELPSDQVPNGEPGVEGFCSTFAGVLVALVLSVPVWVLAGWAIWKVLT